MIYYTDKYIFIGLRSHSLQGKIVVEFTCFQRKRKINNKMCRHTHLCSKRVMQYDVVAQHYLFWALNPQDPLLLFSWAFLRLRTYKFTPIKQQKLTLINYWALANWFFESLFPSAIWRKNPVLSRTQHSFRFQHQLIYPKGYQAVRLTFSFRFKLRV